MVISLNIFAVDLDPVVAAQSLIDAHIRKMPSECCIMLANAHPIERLRAAPRTQAGKLRGHGYPHHGCTKWVKSSYENYEWLVKHALALCDEFTYRTAEVHFCRQFIEWCSQNTPIISHNGLEPHFLAMPAEYKSDDIVASYRSYYKTKQFDKRGRFMYYWSCRGKPSWA